MIQQFLIYTIVAALLAAFIILLLKKVKIVEYFQIHGSKLISDLFGCNFCLSFWTSFLICSIMALLTWNYQYMFIPFFSTPIIRLMI
jgi:hypothetical protein